MRAITAITAIVITIFVVGVVGLGVALAILPLNTQETVTFTVTDKERIMDGEDSKYLIWTDGEVFQDTDSLILGKFNSSDIYGSLKEGETYECRVYGWRIPFFSMYRNIINCNPK